MSKMSDLNVFMKDKYNYKILFTHLVLEYNISILLKWTFMCIKRPLKIIIITLHFCSN